MKILVVDDERMICDGTVQRIRHMNLDWVTDVDPAYSAEEALDKLKKQHFQLMFTDIRMGDMDGLTLIEEANRLCPEMHSVIITAYGNFEYAQKAVRIGAWDYLLKPCSIEAMEELICKANRLQTEESAVPEAGEDNLLQRVETYCRQHLNEDLDMATVANELNISYSHFSRLFHERKGITFSRYILQLKLNQVCEELLHGRKLVEIAQNLGYANSNNLTRAFTKEYGVSPSTWVAQQRKE